MSYLLEIHQDDTRYVVGTFKSEKSIQKFIEKVPFIKKETYKTNGYSLTEYSMQFKDIPEYYEVTYNNYSYVLSKYSFIPNDTEIYFVWFPIHQWDIKKSTTKTPIIGNTIIDAYSIPNTEVIEYIKDREQLFI